MLIFLPFFDNYKLSWSSKCLRYIHSENKRERCRKWMLTSGSVQRSLGNQMHSNLLLLLLKLLIEFWLARVRLEQTVSLLPRGKFSFSLHTKIPLVFQRKIRVRPARIRVFVALWGACSDNGVPVVKSIFKSGAHNDVHIFLLWNPHRHGPGNGWMHARRPRVFFFLFSCLPIDLNSRTSRGIWSDYGTYIYTKGNYVMWFSNHKNRLKTKKYKGTEKIKWGSWRTVAGEKPLGQSNWLNWLVYWYK